MKSRVTTISRRSFLSGAGITALGVGLARTPINAFGSEALPPLPWPYPVTDPLDPDSVRKRAYCLYYKEGGCGHGGGQSIIDALAEKMPDPWSSLPRGLYKYGACGVVGWSTICGALNGSIAVLNILGAHGQLGDALMDYYSTTILPTDALEGWVPDDPSVPVPLTGITATTSESPLCHISVSKWAATAGVSVADPSKKDRCAKLVGDIVAYAVGLLNNHFVYGVPLAPWAPPEDYAECYSCHTETDMVPSQHGKMDCHECHDASPPPHGEWEMTQAKKGRN